MPHNWGFKSDHGAWSLNMWIGIMDVAQTHPNIGYRHRRMDLQVGFVQFSSEQFTSWWTLKIMSSNSRWTDSFVLPSIQANFNTSLLPGVSAKISCFISPIWVWHSVSWYILLLISIGLSINVNWGKTCSKTMNNITCKCFSSNPTKTIITGWWYIYPSEKYEFVSWVFIIPYINGQS